MDDPAEPFDALVIGAGQAGPTLAARFAAAGHRVAIVERHRVGGTCVNTGCTPTKTLVASASVANAARRAAEFGVVVPGPVSVDLSRAMCRAAGVARQSREGLEAWLDGTDGVTLIRGHARFVARDTIEIGDRRLSAPRIFLDVGGRAARPAIPGLDQVDALTNSSILALDDVPDHLVVLGGSYIALEYAQMFRRFGAAVTVVARDDRLLAREDADIADTIRIILEGEGVVFRLGATGLSVAPDGGRVAVRSVDGPAVIGSHLLVALGRIPNTGDLGLDRAGVATDGRGFVTVDDRLETSTRGIWALGDCNGRGAFTHTAFNDGEIVAANLLDGENRRVGDRIPAYALYTDPPLGRVGLTLADARATGRRILVAERPMTRVARAVEKGDARGLMRLVVDADTDAILGAAILGPGGDEAIHAVLDTMGNGGTASRLARTMHIHPTVAELLPTLAGELGAAGEGA